MSHRLTAAVAACLLAVGALAADKKKLDYAPETGPQPRTLQAPITLLQDHFEYTPRYLAGEPVSPSRDQGIIRIYAVGDLVVPIPAVGAGVDKTAKTHEAELIKKLTATVEPKCWASAGGSAMIDYYPLGMTLVVNAPPGIHTAVEKYLDGLRQMQDTQCSIEIKIVSINDAGLEKLGLARDFLPNAGEVRTRIKFLSADNMPHIDVKSGDVIEACMPKLTVLNGQEGSVTVGETQHFLTGVTVQMVKGQMVFTPKNEPHDLGICAKVRPDVSADGKFVKLAVNVQAHDLVVKPVGLIPLSTVVKPVNAEGKEASAPFTQFLQDPRIVTRTVDETVTVPDGGTVVFYGGPATIEGTIKEVVPTFADVPFLNDVFSHEKKVRSTNHLLVFATPRAIRPECDECVQCAGGVGKLPELMAEYHRACREGNAEKARRLALECVVLDPMCFGKK